jgi:amino acid permease
MTTNKVSDDTEISSNLLDEKDHLNDLEHCEHSANEMLHLEANFFYRWFGPIRSGSLRGSTFAMASITFGGGCLAFPYAVMQCGPIVGLIIFLICGLCSYYTLKILLDDGVKAKILDYNQLLELTQGKGMVTFSDINNIIMCIGIIMSYQLTVYRFAAQLGHKYFSLDLEEGINKLILMGVCLVCIQIPLSLLKNISTLQYASLVGTFALVYSIIVIVAEAPFYMTRYLEKGGEIPWFRPISWGWLDTFSTFMFGFASHNGIFQVFTELKRPSVIRYYKVLDRSFIIEIILYVSIAFGGFFSTFLDTRDVFLDRIDLEGFIDIPVQIAKISLFVCLHCTMAINYNIMRMSFKSMFFNGDDIPFFKDLSMVVFIYILSNCAVYYISNVTQILGIIGGFCTIIICFVNPILIHLKLGDKDKEKNKLDRALSWGIMIFVTFFGCAATLKSLLYPIFYPTPKK